MKEREEEITIDLVELWAVLKKNVGFIKKITAGCAILGAAYLIVVPPTYESTALLRIKQPKGIASSLLESMPGGNTMATQQLMSTYAEILKSRSVVVPVIEKTEQANDDGKYPAYEGYVKGRVTTNPFKNTEIMQVTVNAKTPEGAQKANELLVNGFLERLTELVRTEQKATRTFIEERVTSSKKDLAVAEEELAKYKAKHAILAPDAQVKLAMDKISMVDKLKAENQVSLEAARARADAVNGQLGANTPSIADNTVISSLQKRIAELESERISFLEKYTEKHPRVIEVNKDLAGLRRSLDEEIQRVAQLQAPSNNTVYQGLLADKFRSEAEVAVAQHNLATLSDIDNQYKENIGELTETEREFISLYRDVSVAQEIYIMLAKRLEEAKVAEVAVSTEVQVVDTPTLPETPVKPRKALTMVLAVLLGAILSSGIVIAKELLNKTIKTSEDVEHYLGLPVLGNIPEMGSLKKAQEKNDAKEGFFAKLGRYLWKK